MNSWIHDLALREALTEQRLENRFYMDEKKLEALS